MKPSARGLGSYGAKDGIVLPLLIRGTRRPSRACWPRAQDTCDWFTVDPFAPVVTISAKVCRAREREVEIID